MKYPLPNKPESRSLPDNASKQDFNFPVIDKNKHTDKAIFLDRDGTINVEHGYLLDPNDVELCPTAGEAIHTINSRGILTIVITNQAAIDKNLLSIEQFEKINERLWNELSKAGAHYDALYYCPHSPEITPGCFCRKPNPGLLLQAANDFNIDLSSSFMIGDKLTDMDAGRASGCKTILVLTGRGEKARQELSDNASVPPDFIAHTLQEAVEWILTQQS